MKKQTAVEWLNDQLEYYGSKVVCEIDWLTLEQLITEAIQLEREQIIDAYDKCFKITEGKEYYNELYGGNNE